MALATVAIGLLPVGQAASAATVAAAAPGTVSAFPDSLVFGNVVVQTSKTMSVKVSNSSNKPVPITGIQVEDAEAEFALASGSGSCATSIKQKSQCYVYVTFLPKSMSINADGNLSISITTSPGVLTVPLYGSGISESQAGKLAVTPESVNFVATCGVSAAPNQSVTLANSASTGSSNVVISSVTLSGDTGFRIVKGGCAAGQTLIPQQSCQVPISYSNTTTGTRTSTLTVASSVGTKTSALTGTCVDRTPPSVPAGVVASALTSDTIRVTWNASTDNSGSVAGYRVFRNGTAVGTTTTTAYSDSGLAANTAYTYTVTAFDSASPPNESSPSAPATATTLADTTAPTVPKNVAAEAISSSAIKLSWTASTDSGTGVAGYKVFRDGAAAGTTTGTTFTDTELKANTTYYYKVSAYDHAPNYSAQSMEVSATTLALPDTTPPSIPGNVKASATSSSTINVSWTASTDDSDTVAGYHVFRDGTLVGTVSGTTFGDSGLTPNTPYAYTVSAYDGAANESLASSAVYATTEALADTTPPSDPTGVEATALSNDRIRVTWTASTDDSGTVAGYNVFRDGTAVGKVSGPTFTDDKGLAPNTTYAYTVTAYDGAANESSPSMTAYATTPALPDTTPPTAPTGLQATATGTDEVSLTWNASTDSESGVAGYKVYRGTFLVGTTLETTLAESGLQPGETYTYQVTAYDAANPANESARSVAATITLPITQDVTPPSVPSGVSAAADSSTQVTVSWTASIDAGSGVAGYSVFRNGVLAIETANTSFTDADLTAGTLYSYTIRAYDAAVPRNQSEPSAPAEVTTPFE